MALAVLSIALTAPFLGIADLGTYAVLQALLAWATVLALGLPDACSGILAKFHRQGNLKRGAAYLGSAAALVAFAALACIAMVIVYFWFHALTGQLTNKVVATCVALTLALLSLPFLLAQSGLNADGAIARSTAWSLLNAGLAVLAIWCVTLLNPPHEKRLLAAVIATGGATLFTRAAMYCVEWRRMYPGEALWPQVAIRRTRTLLGAGFPFLIINLAALTAFQVDRFVAYKFLSAADAAALDSTLKLLMAAHTLYSVLLAKLWRTVGEPWNRGDGYGARRATVDAFLRGVLFWAMAGAAVLPLIRYLIFKLTSGAVVITDMTFVVAAFVYVALRGLTDTFSIALFAARLQARTVRIVICHGLLNIPFSIGGCLAFGLPGILIGQIASLALTSTWLFPRIFWRATELKA